MYVTKLESMFQECNDLLNLDLSNFNTSHVTNMGWMFYGCHKLKQIKGINKFKTINVTIMKQCLINVICWKI